MYAKELYTKSAYYNDPAAKHNWMDKYENEKKKEITLAGSMTNEPEWKGPYLLMKCS